jgi:tetratricopeptide (TPR) repeat protein
MLGMGQVEDVERITNNLERAVEIDPTWVVAHLDLAWRLVGARDLGRAQTEIDTAFELDSLYPETWWAQAEIHCLQGRYQAALAAADRYAQLTGIDVGLRRGYYYALAGRTAAAREILRQYAGPSAEDSLWPESMAMIHVALGEPEPAFPILERATRARHYWDWFSWHWDPIRAHPRFQALLQKVGVADRG